MVWLAVYVVDLRGPKEQHDEKVAAREEGDEQDQRHRLLGLAEQFLRSHWIRGIDLPDEERGDEDQADDEGR